MATATAPNVTNLPVDQIDPSPDNPRTAFGGDLGDLTALTELIKAQGVLQRLVVCPEADSRFQLVFGHRRLAAAKLAGLAEVPVEIRDYDAAERFTAMYGENFGREGLTPLQEAFAYQQALERKGSDGKKLFTQRTLAQQLGVGQAKISKYTGIFKLPEHVVDMLKGGELTITEAVHLVPLAKYPARVEAALRDVAAHRDVDMETAVRMQQADIDREAKVAKTLKELQTAGVRIAPDDWRERGGKKLGDGVYELDVAVEEHAAEPCHAAMVTHHGEVAYVCTEPNRHRPAAEPAAEPTPTSDLADAEVAPIEPAAEAATDSDSQPPEAPADPAVAAPPVGPATPQDTDGAPQALAVEPPPTPTPEEVAAKARMEAARAAAAAEREEREQREREFAANLEAAYQARTGALRTLLAGRLSRPETTRLLANFLVQLVHQDLSYDDSYLRHVLSLDEHVQPSGDPPVLAFAGKGDDALLRAAVGVVADNAEEVLGAGDEPDFTNPLVVLLYQFLTTVAAYKPSDFERAQLEQDSGEGEPVDTPAAAPEASPAGKPGPVTAA